MRRNPRRNPRRSLRRSLMRCSLPSRERDVETSSRRRGLAAPREIPRVRFARVRGVERDDAPFEKRARRDARDASFGGATGHVASARFSRHLSSPRAKDSRGISSFDDVGSSLGATLGGAFGAARPRTETRGDAPVANHRTEASIARAFAERVARATRHHPLAPPRAETPRRERGDSTSCDGDGHSLLRARDVRAERRVVRERTPRREPKTNAPEKTTNGVSHGAVGGVRVARGVGDGGGPRATRASPRRGLAFFFRLADDFVAAGDDGQAGDAPREKVSREVHGGCSRGGAAERGVERARGEDAFAPSSHDETRDARASHRLDGEPTPRGGVRHLAPRHHGSLHQTPRAHLLVPAHRHESSFGEGTLEFERHDASEPRVDNQTRDAVFSHLGVALERRRRVARELRPRPERVRTRHEHAVVSHTFGGDGEPTPTLGVESKRGERRRRDAGFSPRESSRRLRARFPNRDGEREPRTNHPSNRDDTLSNASREYPRRGVRVRATPPRVKRRLSQPTRRHATIHPTHHLRQIRRGAKFARPRVKGPRRRAPIATRHTPSNRDPTSTRLRRLFRPRRRGSRERLKSDDAEDPTRRLGVGDARAARLSRARGRLLAPSGDERARETCRVVFESL